MARIHFQAQQYWEAIRILSKLLSNEIFSIRAHSSIGSCLLMLKQISSSTQFVDRALQQDPCYVPTLLNLANALKV
jgi:tetratricopeptide (TPR) repeat protein